MKLILSHNFSGTACTVDIPMKNSAEEHILYGYMYAIILHGKSFIVRLMS